MMPRMFHFPRRSLLIILGVVLIGSLTVLGVGTSHWTQQSESDFKAGTFDSVVATNLNELKLSRSVKTLFSQDNRVSAVYALAEGSDGTIYAGTGPQGVLLSIKNGTVKTVATLGADANIFSLLFDSQGRLLIGTGGEKGTIYRIDHPDQPVATEPATTRPSLPTVFSSDGVQYIWSMTQASDGTIYAATGPNGQLFAISPDGKSKVLFECEQNNLLCVIGDGKENLYIGTDPSGLVYRVNRKSGEPFILYDAGESEVRSLALDKSGNLYAATADAGEPMKQAAENDTTDQGGHPETGGVTPKDLPSQPPTSPKPPELPVPGPSEPKPIPKNASPTTRAMSLSDDPGDQPEPPPLPSNPNEPQANPMLPNAEAQQPAAQPIPDTLQKPSNGNAIYRISPDGFVTEAFRQQVTVYSMIEDNGLLLAGTGREGTVYQIEPSAEETVSIATVDPKDVLCLLRAKDGQVWMGLANSGQISVMGAGFAQKGTYTSTPLDAKQVSRFGKINLHGSLPDGTALTIATRSGNVADPSSKGWSSWGKDVPATEYVAVDAPSARFLQYRLTFSSTDGKQTPTVTSVSAGYQVPNMAPVVRSVKVAAANTNPKSPEANANDAAIPPAN
ncbi:MAG: hypothetical protein JO353_04465, partial [Phycisphaerae bacterium]|nr:hypothetical protein [Phycisphaerae bacterium]